MSKTFSQSQKAQNMNVVLNGIETILYKFFPNYCILFLYSIQTVLGVIRNVMEFAIWPGAISTSREAAILVQS